MASNVKLPLKDVSVALACTEENAKTSGLVLIALVHLTTLESDVNTSSMLAMLAYVKMEQLALTKARIIPALVLLVSKERIATKTLLTAKRTRVRHQLPA